MRAGILISQFWNVETLLHFNFVFSLYSSGITRPLMGKLNFSLVFNFTILSYSQNSEKFYARKNNMVYTGPCHLCYALSS